MHMADALLSPAVGTAFWAGALGTIAYSSKKLKETMDDRMVPLMGVVGAFIFAAQMINFTIPGTGSSGHLGGGMILAVILGPYAALVVMASVLTVQALFFADGGLLALGCNIWNLGVYPCFIAYPLIYKPLTKNNSAMGRLLFASLLSAVVGLQIGAFSVVVETLLSGRSELPFKTFLLMMQPIHLGIGIVEGIVTAGVISYLRSSRPELLEIVSESGQHKADKSVLLTFLVLAILTGGALSWFASTSPDGLESSIEKVYGRPELPEQEHGISGLLKGLQRKTAFLPDYNFKKAGSENNKEEAAQSWPGVNLGTSLSGIIGAIIVLGFVLVIGIGIRAFRHKKNK